MESKLFKSGEKCPKTGYYLQKETGLALRHEKDDTFDMYFKKTGEIINNISIVEHATATYEFIGEKI